MRRCNSPEHRNRSVLGDGPVFYIFFHMGSDNFGQSRAVISKICIKSCNSGGVRGEYRRYFTPRPVIASQSADWRGNPFFPGATDSHGSDIGHCLGMTRGRAATWGGPYGMGSTDTIHCRGGYDPPGVLRFAPSSVSLRSTASPLRGEAYKARLPSLPPSGGKVARRPDEGAVLRCIM